MEIVYCSSEDEYRAFGGVRRRDDQWCIPVLGPPRAWHAAAAPPLGVTLVESPGLEQPASPRKRALGSHLVVAPVEGGVREAAELFASTTGRPLALLPGATRLTDADLSNLESLTLVLTADQFPGWEELLWRIWRSRPEVAIGLLTGRDLQAVTWSVAKALAPEPVFGERLLVISADEQDGKVLPGAEVEYVDGRRTSPLSVEGWRLAHDLDCVAVSAHGKEDYVHVGLFTLCGLRPGDLQSLSTNRAPQCYFGHGCCKPGLPEPLHGWTASTVFVNSCSSAKLTGGLYETDFTMPLSAVDGAIKTYVGTLRAKDICAMEHWLFAGLWRAGRPAGEIVAILNRVAEEAVAESPCFVLVGDPLRRRPAVHQSIVEFHPFGGTRPWLTTTDGGKTYYGVHARPGGHAVYAVGAPARVTEDPFPSEARNRLAAEMRDLSDLTLLLPDLERFDGQRREVIGRLRHAARLRQRARYEASRYQEARAGADAAIQLGLQVRKSVLEYLRRDLRGDRCRTEEVLEESMVTFDRTLGRCPCGQLRELRRTRHRAFGQLERSRSVCWRCSVAGDSGLDDLEVSLAFDQQAAIPGADAAGRLLVRNLGGLPRRGNFVVGCPQIAGHFEVVPDVGEFEVEGGARTEVPFSLRLDRAVMPHSWVIRALVLVGMQLALVRAPLQVTAAQP